MDNLTHTAVGLFLSRAGLKNWTPRATPILLLAANLPDIDIVSAAGGSLNYLHYHRHWTHSLLAMPVLALLAVAVVRLVGRKPVNWFRAWLAAMIAVLTHLMLDLTNIYGIRLLLPFSSRWLRLDLTSVIDLWIWAVCLMAILGPLIAAPGRLGNLVRRRQGAAPWPRLRLVCAGLCAALQRGPGCAPCACNYGSRYPDLSKRAADPGCRLSARDKSFPLGRLGGDAGLLGCGGCRSPGRVRPDEKHHPA
jgi:membrane-bound metal-dependent hydrolase YbcI (DUF457 family)